MQGPRVSKVSGAKSARDFQRRIKHPVHVHLYLLLDDNPDGHQVRSEGVVPEWLDAKVAPYFPTVHGEVNQAPTLLTGVGAGEGHVRSSDNSSKIPAPARGGHSARITIEVASDDPRELDGVDEARNSTSALGIGPIFKLVFTIKVDQYNMKGPATKAKNDTAIADSIRILMMTSSLNMSLAKEDLTSRVVKSLPLPLSLLQFSLVSFWLEA
jgi:hypothetical protein